MIRTKYYGPTDTRGSRIVARCNGRQLTMPYDHELSATQNHATAAAMLACKLKLAAEQQTWSGRHNGHAHNKFHYVFAKSLPADRNGIAFEAFRLGGPDAAIPYSYKVF